MIIRTLKRERETKMERKKWRLKQMGGKIERARKKKMKANEKQ